MILEKSCDYYEANAYLTNANSVSELLDYCFRFIHFDNDSEVCFNKYYSSYLKNWNPYIKYQIDSQYSELASVVPTHDGCSILDLGCGCGVSAIFLALTTEAEVTAIDIDSSRLQTAIFLGREIEKITGRKLRIAFINASLFDVNQNVFDFIWLQQTFHHLEPRKEAAKKISSMLKNDGRLVIQESNALNPIIQSILFARRGWGTIGSKTDIDGNVHMYGVERVLRLKALSRLFLSVGISPVTQRYFRILPNWHWPETVINIENRVPHWLPFVFTHYNYVGKKVCH